jgi:hypothetical protein
VLSLIEGVASEEGLAMAREKIRFLIDERGRKQSVVLPIKEYQELLEDLADLALIAERKNQPTEPLDVVKKRLEEKW